MYSNCNNTLITDLSSFLINNDNFLIDDNSVYLNSAKPFRLLETDYKLILTQNKIGNAMIETNWFCQLSAYRNQVVMKVYYK